MQLRSNRKRAIGASAAALAPAEASGEVSDAQVAEKPRKAPRRASNPKLQQVPAAPGDGDKILYRYETLMPATLVRRYKRFLADVVLLPAGPEASSAEVEQEEITVHCPNTGPMVGMLDEPSPRIQLSKSADPKRKYAYTLEMIQISNGERNVWIGVHSALANRMVERALLSRWMPELGAYDAVQREVKFAKNSRVDFILSTTDEDGAVTHEKYVEVKSVTLALNSDNAPDRCAVFPDTVSTRAQKHVTELTELVEAAAKKKQRAVSGAIVFLVQRDDCQEFAPSIVHDEKFAELCTVAAKSGIQLLAYACSLEPDELSCTGQVRLLHALSLKHLVKDSKDDEGK